MKVCMISTFPPERCGVAYYTAGLVKGLKDLVSLCIIANRMNGVAICWPLIRCWKRDSFFYIFQILYFSVRSKARMIHLQHHYSLYGGPLSALEFPFLLVGLKLARRTLVITLHSIIPMSKLSGQLFRRYGLGSHLLGLKKLLMITLLKLITLFADGLIVHDRMSREALVNDYGVRSTKVFIVPNGVSDFSSLASSDAKVQLGFSGRAVILYQGFITEGKGVDILIKAFKKVHQVYNNTLLVIAGGFRSARMETRGYGHTILKLLSDKDLAGSIVITGFVPEGELPRYFSAADIIVLPYTESDVLGISEVLAEVSLMGKPIVGTKTPKLVGILRDKSNSLLVDPGNVDRLANAILQLLGDEQLGLRLSNNLSREASGRTWDKIGLMTLAVYKDVIKRQPHGKNN